MLFPTWFWDAVKSVVLIAAGWLAWSVRHAFKAGWNIQKYINDLENHKRDTNRELNGLQSRMDNAGEKTSELATFVQGMPERLRDEFLPRREAELLLSESKADRQRLWNEVNNLWSVVNRREDEKRRR